MIQKLPLGSCLQSCMRFIPGISHLGDWVWVFWAPFGAFGCAQMPPWLHSAGRPPNCDAGVSPAQHMPYAYACLIQLVTGLRWGHLD